MKKVYIAGPITDNPEYKEDFAAVEVKLIEMGLEPVNPAAAPEGLTYKEYIDRGLMQLMGCDAICCISRPPWIEEYKRLPASRGERLEFFYATTTGLPLMRAWKDKEHNNEGSLQRAKWIIEIPKCWPGMFGEEAEPCEK